MKAVLKTLRIFTIFIASSYWQSTSVVCANDIQKASGYPAIAAEQSTASGPSDAQAGEMHFPVFRTLGGTGLVFCLMIGVYFAARKLAPKYFAKAISERNLKIIETLPMGDKRSISVVEIGGNRFLVGNTPHQINLLAALPEPISFVSEPDALRTNPKEIVQSESRSPFRNLFEVEKRQSRQYMGNPLPDDIRAKMRQLKDALER